jgi:N-acyl-phosphatidylethanolamine-hydrolysing phospholipase D
MGDGLSITFVPAQHFAARGVTDRYRTLWGGFVVERKGLKVYFAADSGWFDGFRTIGERLGPFDLALLPIGAYEPRWFMTPVHVTPEDAVQAHLDVRSRLSVAMHFGTFRLTDEPIDEPVSRLRAALAERDIPDSAFVVPEFGETVLTRKAEALPGSTYGGDRTRRS